MSPRNIQNNNQGFTLIEALVIVAMLSIILGVAVPMMNNYKQGLIALADDEQFKNAVAKARNYAKVNNTSVVIENDAVNSRIRVLEPVPDSDSRIVSIYPIENSRIFFYDSNGVEITNLQVASSGAFNDQNEIAFVSSSYSDGHSATTKTLTLLRSGRLE